MTNFKVVFIVILVLVSLISCSLINPPEQKPGKTVIDHSALLNLPDKAISYQHNIKPIIGSRCVVCHGCYDAPCQLKLSSMEGLQRGVSKTPVYNSRRIKHAQQSRLFIDAKTIPEWRQKGFFPIINEQTADNGLNNNTAEDNLKYSLMYHMLNLKQRHPQPRIGRLNDNFNLNLDDKQECATLGEFAAFSNNHSDWGMPYGLPNLSDKEYKLLVQWIAQGSPAEKPEPLNHKITTQVEKWETFFNQSSLKNQLTSRYIYEHIYLSHLYFSDLDSSAKESRNSTTAFFRLVRSSAPPGQPINEIATTRPYDSPGKAPFYYRLRQDHSQTVIKDHKTYALSDKKMRRYKQLFIEPDYKVTKLPSYHPDIASNPFETFKDIPPVSRYKFLLDDAHFFIEGFIKGSVCRGQVALNVIEDYFWVVFLDPELKISTLDADFLKQNAKYFQLPAEKENTLNILSLKTRYWKNQKKYLRAKIDSFKHFQQIPIDQAINFLYSGNDDENPNAALTIFRHFDSASVIYGLLDRSPQGPGPKTTMVVDYPVLERIHYLLVAGFDVYGNLGHQLNTRVYMEFLRMEGEDNFLAFLPSESRKELRKNWYKGIREKVDKIFKMPLDWMSIQSVTGYKSNQPKLELYQKLKQYFKPVSQLADRQNYGSVYKNKPVKHQEKIDQFMQKVNSMHGDKLKLIPDVTFIRLRMDNASDDRAFTIINNKAYQHLSSMFEDDTKHQHRDYQLDSLLMVDWLEGSYPNFFLDVKITELEQFANSFKAISNDKDYEQFIAQYGIRRTNSKFWELSDWFYQYYKNSHPIKAGYFDLNRYDNR